MKLYIVRHGETISNEARVHQGPDAPLSRTGLAQTKSLAKRVSKLNDIDLIICSPYLRTRQTLDEILKLKKHKVIFSPLAVEVARPSVLLGKAWEGPESNEIKRIVDTHADDPKWHHSDEENFYDFKNRVMKLLAYIESFEQKNILLVTHGMLAKMAVGLMLFGEKLTAVEYKHLETFLQTKNTGITLADKKEEWRLITWNDHAHLAD